MKSIKKGVVITMNIRKGAIIILCLLIITLTGCGGNENENGAAGSGDGGQQAQISQPIGQEQTEQTEQTQHTDSSENAATGTLEKDTNQKQEDVDEELAKYRKEREDGIKKNGGLISRMSPDETKYKLDLSGLKNYTRFDTRESSEAYEAAATYITKTLKIQPSTKERVYECVDPRILAIYDDNNKGVASGYENDNIFVCEYCDVNETWQYLILVRGGKGDPWKVIYHGNSY